MLKFFRRIRPQLIKENPSTKQAGNLHLILLLIMGLSSCESDSLFSVQNCYEGSAEIMIEFGEEQTKIEPEVSELLKDNKINFKLEYPEKKNIFRTTFKKIKEGLPFKKMIIIRFRDTLIIHHGDNILPMMDTDVIGEIACCPYSICI